MSYQPIEKQVLFSGKKVRLEIHTLADEDGNRRLAEIVVHPGAVVIVPILPNGNVLLIRNRRYAVHELLWELPAGTLEANEDPINCAGRELLEETGFIAGRLKPIGNFFSSPGVLTEKLFAFVAYDLEPSQTNLDEGEEIETVPMPLSRAMEMIRVGEIHDGKTIATLLLFEKFHRVT